MTIGHFNRCDRLENIRGLKVWMPRRTARAPFILPGNTHSGCTERAFVNLEYIYYYFIQQPHSNCLCTPSGAAVLVTPAASFSELEHFFHIPHDAHMNKYVYMLSASDAEYTEYRCNTIHIQNIYKFIRKSTFFFLLLGFYFVFHFRARSILRFSYDNIITAARNGNKT